jgi:hypothetical protein
MRLLEIYLIEMHLASAKRGGHLPHILLIGGSRNNSTTVVTLLARYLNLSLWLFTSLKLTVMVTTPCVCWRVPIPLQ